MGIWSPHLHEHGLIRGRGGDSCQLKPAPFKCNFPFCWRIQSVSPCLSWNTEDVPLEQSEADHLMEWGRPVQCTVYQQEQSRAVWEGLGPRAFLQLCSITVELFCIECSFLLHCTLLTCPPPKLKCDGKSKKEKKVDFLVILIDHMLKQESDARRELIDWEIKRS